MKKEGSKKYLQGRLLLLLCTFLTGVAVIITDLLIGVSGAETVLLKITGVVILSCLSFYIPDLTHAIGKSGRIYHKRRELRFLKKLFLMSGSVKPVDYMQVVNAMYERSYCYRQDLERIMDVLRKSSIDKEDFFSELLEESADLDSKLFYEKLSIGFLYDFDLAVRNIEADFLQEKRAYARFIKKRVNFIHIIGITGLFIAMAVLLIYMLQAWLKSMNFQFF